MAAPFREETQAVRDWEIVSPRPVPAGPTERWGVSPTPRMSWFSNYPTASELRKVGSSRGLDHPRLPPSAGVTRPSNGPKKTAFAREAPRGLGSFLMSLRPRSAQPNSRGLAPLLAALSSVGPLTVDTYLPAMPEIGRALHASPIAVQQTLTAYMLPFALMTLWHGAISDALGRRRIILWGTACYVLASVGCVFVQSIESLMVFRALQGMSAGAGMVVGRAVVRDLFDGPQAQRLMSQVTLVFALAPAIAPILGGWLQVWFGWRSIFVFLVLFGGAAWLLCHQRLPETLDRSLRQPMRPGYLLRSYGQVVTTPAFVAACLAGTLNFSGVFIYIVSAPVFAIEHLHLPPTAFAWIFLPITLGMAGGAALSSRLAGGTTPLRTVGIGYAIMAVAAVGTLVIAFALSPRVPWSVLPLLVYSMGMSLAFPSLTLSALDLFPAQRGLAASCQSFIQTSGAAVNAVLAPLIWGNVHHLAVAQVLLLAGGAAMTYLHFRLKAAPETVAA